VLRPYDLLENVLIVIEKDLKNNLHPNNIAKRYEISTGHLRRLFKFAFKQNITAYIRSRKLSSSLTELYETDLNIMDIALIYGYSYEQTYIRAFKDEFGILPGELRKKGQIVKVKPPLHVFNENKLKEGIIFGPEIVMIPKFTIAGVSHIIPFNKSLTQAPKAAINFWKNEKHKIKNITKPNIYIGFTYNINKEEKHSEYLTSVQVDNAKNIPKGYKSYTIKNCLCARFRYIGKHHYYDLNRKIAIEMYNTIWKFGKIININSLC